MVDAAEGTAQDEAVGGMTDEQVDEALEELRAEWGRYYLISHVASLGWLAIRRDPGKRVITAQSRGELRGAMAADHGPVTS
jgi:hypothetical protein